ncbi:MAG: prolyl-tRNA synthetase associated domain-containing protein [Clostridia bacterium]|nr:prolyl-tRNA synthetase associated domain-containing protein [Clostridia bacterium]
MSDNTNIVLRKSLPARGECTETEYKVFEFLESTGADYTWVAHDTKFAVSEYEDVCRALDIKIIRNIFLENKKGQLFLLMIHADKKFVTKDVSHKVGSSRLQFASAEKLMDALQEEPGGVSNLGLIFDAENKVQLIVDRDLLDAPYLGMVPASRTKSLRMTPADWLEKVVPAMHHDPLIIDID